MNRKWGVGLGIGVMTLLSGLYGVWYWQAIALRDTVISQLTLAEGLGFSVSYNHISTTGFPFSLGVRIQDLEVSRKDDVAFTSKINGFLDLTHSLVTKKQTATILGTHLLKFPPLFTQDPLLIHHSGSASVESSSIGVPSAITLDLKNLEVSGIVSSWKAQTATLGVKAPENWQLMLASPDFNGSFMMNLNNLTIDNLSLPATLPHTLDHFAIEGSYKGPVLTTNLSSDFIRKWRKASGVIELKTLEAKWGKFIGSTNATLVLDANLQPTIAGVLKAKGINGMLDDLSTAKVISGVQIIQAKAAVELVKAMTVQKDSLNKDSSDELSVPITLQDGTLTIGSFEVTKIGKIDWTNP